MGLVLIVTDKMIFVNFIRVGSGCGGNYQREGQLPELKVFRKFTNFVGASNKTFLGGEGPPINSLQLDNN